MRKGFMLAGLLCLYGCFDGSTQIEAIWPFRSKFRKRYEEEFFRGSILPIYFCHLYLWSELGSDEKNPSSILKKLGEAVADFKVESIKDMDKYFDEFLSGKQTKITLDNLMGIFKLKPEAVSDYLMMEYLAGDKYSADVLVSKGNIVSTVIRNNGKRRLF